MVNKYIKRYGEWRIKMDPIMFVKKTTDINFEILNMANKFRYMIEGNKYKRYILKNSRFKDKHAGETCFIIGNGPSIKEMDLSKLSDKYTFMANASINTKLFDVIKPNYHCVYDRAVLNELSDVLRKNFENNKYNTEYRPGSILSKCKYCCPASQYSHYICHRQKCCPQYRPPFFPGYRYCEEGSPATACSQILW